MGKDNSSKAIAIVAVLIGVIGLAIGFAAFSNTLTIKSSATVTADEGTFNVDFSTVNGSVNAGDVTAVLTPADGSFTADDATIDNTNAPTISGLKAKFTEPGQTVTYSFYAHNDGEFVAYLKSIAFNTVSDGKTKVCTAAADSEATADLVQAACDGISISIDVGTLKNITGSEADITGHSLAKDTSEPIVVTIAYADGAQRPDGDIEVAFGDIELLYSSTDGE